MEDDSGTRKVSIEELNKPPETRTDGFSKDEIDTLADLIDDGTSPQKIDLDDTGRFTR